MSSYVVYDELIGKPFDALYTETCEDDPNWRDSKYGGDGTDRCSDMTYHFCNDFGKYSTEAKRACPKTCGVCSYGYIF